MSANGDRLDGPEPLAQEKGRGERSSTKIWRDLGPRAASGVVLIALALASLWRGGAPFVIFWLIAALGLLWEWQRMIGGSRLLARVAVGAVFLAVCADLASRTAPNAAINAALLGAVVLAAIAEPGRRIWSGCGLIYAAAPVIAICVLRASIFDGTQAVLWLFAVVWGADVMAYFGGRLIGGPKLWPQVSPSKTWAGFLVGVSFGALLGAMILEATHVPIGEGAALALGAVIGAVSQAGDLFESSVKRHFGAKDSGRLIPGHGGLMDRLDGFIAAATFAAIVGVLRAGAAAAGLGLLRW